MAAARPFGPLPTTTASTSMADRLPAGLGLYSPVAAAAYRLMLITTVIV